MTDKPKEIFVVSSPRSGNAFLTRMLGDALNSPLQAWNDTADSEYFGDGREGNYIIRKTHATVSQATWNVNSSENTYPKTVFLQRDPRDVIVSRLYYNRVLKSNELSLLGMIGQMYTLPPEYVYDNWVRAWYYCPFVDVCTTFERLKKLGGQELYKILQALETNISLERANEVVENHSFSNMKIQYGDKYDISMHKGISGDWRNHFSRRTAKYMNDILGEFMLEMGFVDSLDWWKELSA